MLEFYAKIKRVLELEKQKGYINSAVSGGFKNFIPFINSNIEKIDLKNGEKDAIISFFQSYESLPYKERRAIISTILEKIGNSESEPFAYANSNQANTGENGTHPEKIIYLQDKALYTGIQSISGIGQKNSKLFAKLGIENIYDLLRFYPRKYQDFSQLKTINQILYGEEVTLTGLVLGDVVERKAKNRNLKISEVILSDSTGTINLTWFNQPFLKNQLKAGMAIVVSGKVDHFRGRFTMSSPEWEILEKEQIHTNRIVPIYPGTAGLSQRQIRNVIKRNINFWAMKILEYLPADILHENNFLDINSSIKQIHFPDSNTLLRNVQNRFAFEEVFFLQLGTKVLKHQTQSVQGRPFPIKEELIEDRKKNLPYTLTTAQNKALTAILKDLSAEKPMSRLLQGDVGSGKTVVAKFAIDVVVDNDAQSAILAPTGILAEQHYKTLNDLFSASGNLTQSEIALLVGNTSNKQRAQILADLKSGQIKCVVGTHALLENDVVFHDLQLVVIDEQHRFGVNQRNLIRDKGKNPHTLVMSATPIPRSLAITLFGDMDITTIDELPPGRLPVQTSILQVNQREKAYDLIRENVRQGFQAFIIYPLIEDDGENEEKSAIANQQRLQKDVFPEFKVGLLHGRMKSDQKDAEMESFRDGKFNILVSTTVIEVGVDIPNATVMVIESANFFGLAQLHQLRGRVGRNAENSFCVLIPDNDEAVENQRLQAMVETNDGFKLADIDLNLRGPGEFLGTRQSGYIGFKFASLTDSKLIEKCLNCVHNIIDDDPQLSSPEHGLLREELSNRWPGVIRS